MEPNCVSYNMEDISGSPSIAKCELNNSTHNEHPDDFKPWSNYNYRGSEVSADYKKNKKAKSVCAEQQISKIDPIFLFLFLFFVFFFLFFFFLTGCSFSYFAQPNRANKSKILFIVSFYPSFVDYTCKFGLQRAFTKRRVSVIVK